jgi:hypothetical protein
MAKIGTTSEISIDSSVVTPYRVNSSVPDNAGNLEGMIASGATEGAQVRLRWQA